MPPTSVASILAATLVLSIGPAASAQGTTDNKLTDATIVAIFDAANTWDIETGNLAAKKATTKAIRDFGKQLVGDHTTVRGQGRDLAHKLHVTPTPPANFGMAKDHEAAVKRLSVLSGPAFDRAFLQHEVAFHKAVLDAVTTTFLPALQSAEVKDFVKKVAPAFTAHMMTAQRLLDNLPKE
jgi:putative membrane protein